MNTPTCSTRRTCRAHKDTHPFGCHSRARGAPVDGNKAAATWEASRGARARTAALSGRGSACPSGIAITQIATIISRLNAAEPTIVPGPSSPDS
eukprot:4093285-Prymnesium_polylepis.1